MAFHTFLATLAYDEASRRGVAGTIGKAVDQATGVPVEVFDMDGNPTILVTNASGYVGYFKADSAHRILEVTFGHLTLPMVALEIVEGAADAVAQLETFTISHVAIDTDGQPYFSPGTGTVRVLPDTDGKPYYIPS